jgi:hypothetical protein
MIRDFGREKYDGDEAVVHEVLKKYHEEVEGEDDGTE